MLLSIFSLLLTIYILVAVLWGHRLIERWLHFEVFKVGWLITQRFKSVALLYYCAFLPGVFVHSVLSFITATLMNVTATFEWRISDSEDIRKLDLSLVHLDERNARWRISVIRWAPSLVILLLVVLVAPNVFAFETSISIMAEGTLSAVGRGLRALTSTPDFALWMYIVLSFSNVIYIDHNAQPFTTRLITIVLVSATVLVLVTPLLDTNPEALSLQMLLGQAAQTLLQVFVVVVIINLLFAGILGLLEAGIERFSKRSVTVRRGVLTTITRQESLETRLKAREKREREREKLLAARNAPTVTSLAEVDWMIGSVPGEVPVTQAALTLLDMADSDDGEASDVQINSASQPALSINRSQRSMVDVLEMPSNDEVDRLPRAGSPLQIGPGHEEASDAETSDEEASDAETFDADEFTSEAPDEPDTDEGNTLPRPEDTF